jgi:hypothetical protein
MARASYRVIDEPGPTGLEQAIVNPIWPMFATMMAGSWLGYPWYMLNSLALGGRRRFWDLGIALGGWAVSAALLFGIGALASRLLLDERNLVFALLAPIGVRMVVLYWLYLRQETTYQLYVYFGGKTRNALILVFAGAFLRGTVLGGLSPFWQTLLG